MEHYLALKLLTGDVTIIFISQAKLYFM